MFSEFSRIVSPELTPAGTCATPENWKFPADAASHAEMWLIVSVAVAVTDGVLLEASGDRAELAV